MDEGGLQESQDDDCFVHNTEEQQGKAAGKH